MGKAGQWVGRDQGWDGEQVGHKCDNPWRVVRDQLRGSPPTLGCPTRSLGTVVSAAQLTSSFPLEIMIVNLFGKKLDFKANRPS